MCPKFIPKTLATKFGTRMMTVTAVSRCMMRPSRLKAVYGVVLLREMMRP
jgi:hypothetical protein